MERGIEDRYLGHARKRLARAVDLLERTPVVERSEHRELIDRPLDIVVHQRRPDEAAPAVDYAVTDGVRCREAVDLAGFVPADEVKLEAHGACVDYQDVDGRGFS
jgi:hypothetical protein